MPDTLVQGRIPEERSGKVIGENTSWYEVEFSGCQGC